MAIKYPFSTPYALTTEEVIALAETDKNAGLSLVEATRRTQIWGLNSYKAQQQKSAWIILFQQFKSPIVLLLTVGMFVSIYFKDFLEAAAIAAVILINALIGFLMEMQARSSMLALQKMDVILARVIRDGVTIDIPAEQLTPGDIVPFEAGDIIPADGRLIEAHQLQCDESSLTGESFPVGKILDNIAHDTPVSDQRNMVFKGTSVINGNGKAVITGIADDTQLGVITSLVDISAETPTPLDKKLNGLSKKLIWITLGMTAVFSISSIIQGKTALLIIETSIALAVAAIPEGLPIVATVALSYGMLLMGRRNAIVKKLSAVETLGSTGVILTDKTGTLTENKIYADTLGFPTENIKVYIENNVLRFPHGAIKVSNENFEKLVLVGALCNNSAANGGDPVEIALATLANTSEFHTDNLNEQYPRIAELPFNSDIMMMGTLHKTSSGFFAAAKGSVEHLLERCAKMQLGAVIKTLTREDKHIILKKSEKMAASGLRVLAFAYKEGAELDDKNYLDELIYTGMVGFLDPPRIDIKGAIFSCINAGIKVIMITGDHPQTALNIAKK